MTDGGDDDAPTREAATRRDAATERDDDTAHAETVRAPLITKLAESQDAPLPRARSSSQLDLSVGQKLGGRYVVRGFLGMGGMGAVYHVFDQTLGEDVALKAVRSAIAASSGLRDEVKIAQKVTHENVCRTYDLEDVDGRHYVKMEYVPGETLAARIEAGQLPITTVIRIARGIATGLAAAHARGIVHRDLKPGNVMLDGERVVLMDFGLAQYASRSDGDRSGTPGYMSPEQLAGIALDHRSDLFALGCLLYEMLIGERVFGTGSMTEIETRQTTTEVPDVRSKRPEVPKWLARATALLLSRDRERRSAGLALLHRDPPRVPFTIVVTLAIGVVLLGAGIAWWATREEPKWRGTQILVKRPSSTHELVGRASITLDSSAFLFIAESGEGQPPTLYKMPLTGGLLGGSLERISDAPHGADQVRHLRDGSGLVFCGHDKARSGLVFLQDRAGGIVELGAGHDPDDCGDAIVAIRALDSGDEYRRWQLVEMTKPRPGAASRTRILVDGLAGEPLDHARCDSTGKRVVYSHNVVGGIKVMLLERANPKSPDHLAIGETPTFTPGGRSIVYAHEGKLVEMLLDRDREVHELTEGREPYFVPEVSPDGSVLLFSRETYGSTMVIGGDDRPAGRPIPAEMEELLRMHVTPDLASAIVEWPKLDQAIAAIDIQSGAQRRIARGSRTFLSRDGRRVFFVPSQRPAELHEIALNGGESRLVVEIPEHPIRDGYDAEDGIHLSLELFANDQPTGEIRGVRIPHGTREVITEGRGLVVPAPGARWRALWGSERAELTASDGRKRTIPCLGPPRWVDDHRIACFDGHQTIEILDADTEKSATVQLPWPSRHAFLIGDGTHWAAIRDSDAVTRLAITNFATRPWAP